ncbi:XkdQ/YqbQ family protein [Lactococcus petauri]|uniref:XkdQ/YqbQ family protein n=1 Tax=Lactococcus petauri TaxID=1940789 RepID=UPI0038550FFD
MAITEFIIERKMSKQHTEYDVRELISGKVDWESDIDFSAGTLSFSLDISQTPEFYPQNGDIVRFKWDGVQAFYGRIFKVDTDEKEQYNCVAYDNLRYLKSEGTVIFPVSTVAERYSRIMQICNLPFYPTEDTRYKLDSEVCDGQTYFSMLQSGIEETNKNTKDGQYFLRTVWDKIQLFTTRIATSTLVIEANGLLSGWAYQSSAENLYNIVQVVKDTTDSEEKDEKRKTFTTKEASAQDSITRYGKLSKIEKADKDMNDAQMQNKANQLLKELSKEETTLKLSSLGAFHDGMFIRAGDRFWVKIDNILVKERIYQSKKITHHFDQIWTTDFEGVLQ